MCARSRGEMDITRRFGRRILGSSPGESKTKFWPSQDSNEKGVGKTSCFSVEEGVGKPWVSEMFASWRAQLHFTLVRTGVIETPLVAWQATVLPLNHVRVGHILA